MSAPRRLLTTLAATVALTLLGTPGATGPVHAADRDPAAGPARDAPHRGGWTGTWGAAPSHAVPPLPGTSIRNVVHTSVGGRAARIRVTNRFGTAPLRIGAATVALQVPGAPRSPAAVPGSLRAATFGGEPSATVPAGRDLLSDPVPLRVPAAANLLVTLHTPGDPGPATQHRSALQTNFLAPGGDHTADGSGTPYTATTGSWHYLSGVDVLGSGARGTLVALGDSITDGSGSTASANRRWPDRLAARLRALPPHRRLGVVNAGIAGNRLLRDGTGPSALARLDADVLSRPGLRAVIVMIGINDIKGTPEAADPAVYEAAFRRLATRAHARGVHVVGGTIAPYAGHPGYTEAREAVRQAVNRFIRTSPLFDGVADFDAAVRDPARPNRILPAYDPGDHLHFNDAGLQAMADAVDLADLRLHTSALRTPALRAAVLRAAR
ncbi:SGNH/GDSL hydrolase family protein [Streptomyces yaizuensis]|uniref:SGNH/GDSL hydrolase family protein n=1 Tax=Streptomyces yaizuensis TaxID=2989713 RepID=A0ABQ5P5M6_9ACTN|nr:SGNH/GDSL hydrolase family protein [Streptomyces sp. YSPA8]GLF97886.1 SGNH/GDSL hydrolase family protein [Streptomyces sp. YSPA8]